jgi:serine/threonine-protein kinase
MANLAGQREGLIGGRYALHDEIASGGMATVHFGRLLGPAGFSRIVAIKRLHPQLAKEPEFVSMFIDEVRLAARIQHPNVVATIDVVDDANELFLVMEYVHGESLGRLIRLAAQRGRPIPPAIAATVMGGVLHGLHAAHEAKAETNDPLELVHRDVSPQNVIVGGDGVARVLDFGIAKAVGRLQTTRAGQIKGKMAYLAPEHVQGGPIDRRTDIYGAAVVLWEALTGVQLFEGENDSIVLARVLAGRVSRPSEFVAGIGPALEAITMRGLDREPANRFATAREMALALQQEVGLVAANEVGDWVAELAAEPLAARARYLNQLERLSARVPGMVPAAAPVQETLLSDAGRNRQGEDGPSTRPVNPPGAPVDANPPRRPSQDGDTSVHPVSSSVDGGGPWHALRWSSNRRLAIGGAVAAGLVTAGLIGARAARSSGPRVLAVEEPVVLISPVLTGSASPSAAPVAPESVPEAAETLVAPVASENPHASLSPKGGWGAAASPPGRRAGGGSPPSVDGGRGPRIVRGPWSAQPPRAMVPALPAAPASAVPNASGGGKRNCHPPYVVDSAGIKRFKVECL